MDSRQPSPLLISNPPSRVAIFRRKKYYSAEHETHGYFDSLRRNSICFAERKTSEFRSDFWAICHFAADKKAQNSGPRHFVKEKNTQNFVILFWTMSAEDKKAPNSVPNNFIEHSKLRNFVPNYSAEDKKFGIPFPTILQKWKTLGILFQTNIKRKKNFGKRVPNHSRTRTTFKKHCFYFQACDSVCTGMMLLMYEKSFCCYVGCSIKPHFFAEFRSIPNPELAIPRRKERSVFFRGITKTVRGLFCGIF